MPWQPIQDLPEDWRKLANLELPPLVTVWNEQAERLRNSGEFKTYMEKLRREIAIETGIIERLYTLDRGGAYIEASEQADQGDLSYSNCYCLYC